MQQTLYISLFVSWVFLFACYLFIKLPLLYIYSRYFNVSNVFLVTSEAEIGASAALGLRFVSHAVIHSRMRLRLSSGFHILQAASLSKSCLLTVFTSKILPTCKTKKIIGFPLCWSYYKSWLPPNSLVMFFSSFWLDGSLEAQAIFWIWRKYYCFRNQHFLRNPVSLRRSSDGVGPGCAWCWGDTGDVMKRHAWDLHLISEYCI